MARTTSSSDREREKLGLLFAAEIDAWIDSLMAEFGQLIAAAKGQSGERDVTQLVVSENTREYSELRDFFQKVSVILMLETAVRFSSVYGIAMPGRLSQVKVKAAAGRLEARLAGFIEESRLFGMVAAGTTGEAAVDLTLTPRNIDSLRKATEFTASFSANQAVQAAGAGAFSRKRAVATLDKDTTNLCRLRMNGQVVPWAGYFVDPVSGSRWLHPPFIGGNLSKTELFHKCRTVIVPA
jgi:hypothetical protein